jgi:alginate O-acetyltransferase complex protein AlgI
MIFNTVWFWLFRIGTLSLLRLAPVPARKWVALALCSVFHFHYAGAAGMTTVLLLGFFVYGISRFRLKSRGGLAALGIASCVSVLAYTKYRAFFAGLFGAGAAGLWQLGPIPLGISFFTFEFVHYLVELRKGGRPISSFLDFGLFSIFFPSLVAGPIKRYRDFTSEVAKPEAFRPSFESVVAGGQRALSGALKKTLLADPLAVLTDRLHDEVLHGARGVGSAWLLLVALALRIYFDFSGYSDMAIGTARMLNIRIPENFDWPYVSRSIQEFWRRWHMSLSNWIRDYVYIPLGGSRVSANRRLINFVLAFTLCGLWHGAALNFAAWGLWHGAGIGFERILMERPAYARFSRGWGGLATTFTFVSLGWLLFFYPVAEAGKLALALVGVSGR